MAVRLFTTLSRAAGGSEASRASRSRMSAVRSRRQRGSDTYAASNAVGPPRSPAEPRAALAGDDVPAGDPGVGRTLRPIHTPTATLATMAAAASEGQSMGRRGPACSRAAAALGACSALIRASICGQRSRPGSIERASWASELTLRSSGAWLSSLMSAHLHFESLAQELARPVQLSLARALGDPEHPGRLAVRVTIQRMQNERIARALGERPDRGLDLAHLDRCLERPLDCASRVLLVLDARLDGRGLAASRESHVHRDPVQPGRERAARLELRQRPPRVDESLLRTVLRQVLIPGHPQAQAVHPAHVLAIQSFKGARVPRAGPPDERRLPIDSRLLGLRLDHPFI